MIRAGSRALRITTTASVFAFRKYGRTNSSRRPWGASRIGTFHFSDRFVTQLRNWSAMSVRYTPADGELITIEAEESQSPLWLLERLDQSVQQNAVKATIAESDTILMVLEEPVHGMFLCRQIPGA